MQSYLGINWNKYTRQGIDTSGNIPENENHLPIPGLVAFLHPSATINNHMQKLQDFEELIEIMSHKNNYPAA